MQIVPFLGSGIAGKSYVVTRQRRLNCYLENRQDGDKSSLIVYGTPGLIKQFSLATTLRGLFGTQTQLFAVAGSTFYQIAADGTTIYSRSIASAYSQISMANNSTQVLVVDGVGGYYFQAGTLTDLGIVPLTYGPRTCTFVSSRFIVEQPGTQYFWVSNVFDAVTWNPLAFAAASQYSDNLVAVDSLNANLVLFSERHLEFWQDTGATPEPFAPILSAVSEYGLEAIFSRAHVDNSLIFLAHNPQGNPQVCQIRGYQVNVISNTDLDYILNSFTQVSDGVALAYFIDGHPMYQLSLPSANRTFLYDCSTGVWSETQTGLTAAYATRHAANIGTYYAGNTLVSDYSNGNVYMFDTGTYTDNGQTILRELVFRHGTDNFNVFSIDELYIDVQSGVGLNSGQGSVPVVSLECSKDNGSTFGTPLVAAIGKLGNYLNRLIWRRFGSARDFVFRLRMTDPVKFVITSGAISIREKPQ